MQFIVLGSVIVFAVFMSSLKIVPRGKMYVLEAEAKYSRTLQSGVHFIYPFHERVRQRLIAGEQVIETKPITTITKDNFTLDIQIAVYYVVSDTKQYCYGGSDPFEAVPRIITFGLRDTISSLTIDQIFRDRVLLCDELKTCIDSRYKEIGVSVNRVELRDIGMSEELRVALGVD